LHNMQQRLRTEELPLGPSLRHILFVYFLHYTALLQVSYHQRTYKQ
jgi:hypothetical protein